MTDIEELKETIEMLRKILEDAIEAKGNLQDQEVVFNS